MTSSPRCTLTLSQTLTLTVTTTRTLTPTRTLARTLTRTLTLTLTLALTLTRTRTSAQDGGNGVRRVLGKLGPTSPLHRIDKAANLVARELEDERGFDMVADFLG